MADQAIISRHASSVGATQVLIDFGVGVQRVIINTFTADVNVEFNGAANTDSFRISASQPAPSVFDFGGSNIRTVSLLGNGGTANVFVMGIVT